MHGNVNEWCKTIRAYVGPIQRGGSYLGNAYTCRSSEWTRLTMDNSERIGFRVVI